MTHTRQGREYTPRIVRQKVEEELALESGVLDAKEYKVVVKDALTDALVRILSLTHTDPLIRALVCSRSNWIRWL